MNVKLIGRKKELEALREYVSSNRSEFVAVYGRRVGKTFLIRQIVADNFAFLSRADLRKINRREAQTSRFCFRTDRLFTSNASSVYPEHIIRLPRMYHPFAPNASSVSQG